MKFARGPITSYCYGEALNGDRERGRWVERGLGLCDLGSGDTGQSGPHSLHLAFTHTHTRTHSNNNFIGVFKNCRAHHLRLPPFSASAPAAASSAAAAPSPRAHPIACARSSSPLLCTRSPCTHSPCLGSHCLCTHSLRSLREAGIPRRRSNGLSV